MTEVDGIFINSNTFELKVVDSCRIFSNTGSDTFRNVLIYGKEQESRKKVFHDSAKNSSS